VLQSVQCVAVRCSVLDLSKVASGLSESVTVCDSVLQCVIVCCSLLQCAAVCCRVL